MCSVLVLVMISMGVMQTRISTESIDQLQHARITSICVIAGVARHTTLLFLASLNHACYPQHTAVHLTLVLPFHVTRPAVAWKHGNFQVVHNMPRRVYLPDRCTIILRDSMEVSPLFAFWFLNACDGSTDAVVGGRENAGFALCHPNSHVHGAQAMALFAQGNLTVRYPPLEEGYTYVRLRRQNPMLPEAVPKLQRVFDRRFYE